MSEAVPRPRQIALAGVHEGVIERLGPLLRCSTLDLPAGEGALTEAMLELGFEVMPGTAPTPEPADESHPFEVEGVVNPGS